MAEPTDTPAEWIAILLEVVGPECAERVSSMGNGEKDVVLLRLLAKHEEHRRVATALLERVDEALGALSAAGNDLAESLGLPIPEARAETEELGA